MDELRFVDLGVGIAVLFLAAGELYNGILMLFRNQHRLLAVARLAFWMLRRLPGRSREERYVRATNVYARRRSLYGTFAIIGGIWGILLALLIMTSS
jgi:hypothetical protein